MKGEEKIVDFTLLEPKWFIRLNRHIKTHLCSYIKMLFLLVKRSMLSSMRMRIHFKGFLSSIVVSWFHQSCDLKVKNKRDFEYVQTKWFVIDKSLTEIISIEAWILCFLFLVCRLFPPLTRASIRIWGRIIAMKNEHWPQAKGSNLFKNC